MSNKICLNMIVKNESKVIERCLRSVYHLIDSWCIVDTGSIDGTQEIIKNFLKDKPGELIERPWINFGHNRNEALRLGETWGDWLLLIDADMVLEDKGFDKNILDFSVCGYRTIQENCGTRYYNSRILNKKRDWRCIGVTHEYYAPANGELKQCKIEDLVFHDYNDGGSRSDKFERDIILLTKGLQDEPGNARYMFYLAQSYRCTGKLEEAITWYEKRIAAGGWVEECWYSHYMISKCYIGLGDLEKAEWWVNKGFQFYPKRSEAIYDLCKEFRFRGNHKKAYEYYKMGYNIPYPKDDILFISHDVYTHLFEYELTILHYYIFPDDRETGLKKSMEYLEKIQNYPSPEYSRLADTVRANLKFYLPKDATMSNENSITPASQKAELKNATNKICLSMIVKNESKVIERCLSSVYHLIDSWCIVDTGSTDGTQEIIKKVLKDKPGELIEKPWINFGHNRNEAIKLGEKWGDWLLLIDADMVLKDEGFDKSVLDKNLSGYSITQYNEGLEYYNPRILNTDSDWKCVGVTHEYYAPQKKDKIFQEKIAKLSVIDLNDGGARDDKLPRDISLLTRGLLDEPGNYRYMFYLGQTYKCMRKFDEAIYWYGRAAKESKWDEESWYADYMVGFCMHMRGDELEKVSAHLLNNWMRRPTRLEPLFDLAMIYKGKEMWKQAYSLLKICSTTPKPDKDILFLTEPWYRWQALDELAIMAATMKNFNEAIAIYSHLISEKKCPESEKSRISKNIDSINKLMNNVGRTEEDLREKLRDWQKKITNKYSHQIDLKKDPRTAIIAACKGYGIDVVRPWAESLKSSGFDGDVFVVLYSPTDELVKYFKSFGYHVCVGNKEDGQTHVATQRFKVYTAVLKHEIAKDVDYVLHTDIRDVVFQRNPAEWFKNNITQNDLIYASAEGVTYLHEDWNGDGLQLHFGDKLFNEFSGYETLCSGVFGGRKDAFIDLCDMMYDMAFWSKDPAAFIDQHFYNVLIRKVFNSITKITPADSTFTANLGTLIAIPKNSPSWSSGEKTNSSAFPRKRTGTYEKNMLVKLPTMINDQVCTPAGEPYFVVHQYDRYQPWKEKIIEKIHVRNINSTSNFSGNKEDALHIQLKEISDHVMTKYGKT